MNVSLPPCDVPNTLLLCLPRQAQELVQLIGFAATRLLVKVYGGTTLRLAVRDAGWQGSELVALLGREAVHKLSKQYGGTELYVPNCKSVLTRVRDATLHAERDALAKAGESERQIVTRLAQHFNLSDRQVWRILKTVPQKGLPRWNAPVEQGWLY